jgi:hypothetical protein
VGLSLISDLVWLVVLSSLHHVGCFGCIFLVSVSAMGLVCFSFTFDGFITETIVRIGSFGGVSVGVWCSNICLA